jgi:polyprenyl P-hydroxybenzoate/phenylacrylic acid decarboxylase-like protein
MKSRGNRNYSLALMTRAQLRKPLNFTTTDGHIRNMERLCEMGAIIMPIVPAFYHRPRTIQDIIDHTMGKALDVFGIKHNLCERWSGVPSEESFLPGE